ncbi:MAG: glycoside hydrolase family 130 protein [Phycisphaerae bacterium]
MKSETLEVTRRPEQLLSDDKRVIPRYLDFHDDKRIRGIIRRIIRLPEEDIPQLLKEIKGDFHARHRDIEADFRANYGVVRRLISEPQKLSETRRLLIGAYFTMEYSIESAALFNPSIVVHPNQSDLDDGDLRFLMSLRATGEGHISSIVFRRGVFHTSGEISFDPPPRYAYSTRPIPDSKFYKRRFIRKLRDTQLCKGTAYMILDLLRDQFTASELRSAIDKAIQIIEPTADSLNTIKEMVWLSHANYQLSFPADCLPAETVIFPATETESRGMEDLRLVRFTDDDGQHLYYGTYTAFDGMNIHPMLLETENFQSFHVNTITGRYARNKGMALFPRKIDGRYAMLSRHDGESSFVLWSEDLYQWNSGTRIQTPSETWELVQVGNCGSPVETDRGWVVLTHGVGPVRKYSIGALLLDLDDPSQVIGRLKEPLLTPSPEEREGYVPNVVYSCGSIIHEDKLVIPYAMSDSRTAFATVSIRSLVDRMLNEGP